MSEFIKAIVLGIVEGLTEFIPVSSTGHLILVGQAIKFDGSAAGVFEVFIQLGAILAVVVLYRPRFLAVIDLKQNSGLRGKAGLIKLALACFPALVCGALFHKEIKEWLFSSYTVALALVLGGIAMILVERWKKSDGTTTVDGISERQALGIGLFQCLALWPGISRSGATIVGGLLLGLDRRAAAEFSFLVAVPVMCAAVGFDLYKSLPLLSLSDIPIFAVGFIVSFVFAMFAIRWLVRLLDRYTLEAFGYYRIAVGLLVLCLT